MSRGDSLFRQWELLKTLQANRFGTTVAELAQRLECNKRTIQRDFRILRAVFPLHAETRESGRKYWRLSPDFIQSEKLQLTVTEMLSLYLSQQLLAPLAGTPFGDGLASALEKIKTVLPREALDYFGELDDAFLIKSLGREDYSAHGDEIAALNEAILNQRVVRVTYHSASQNRELTSDFHPYGMVLLAASLYCIGHLAEYDEVRTLKVSRMQAVRPTRRTFEKPATFSLAKHTRGAFGVFGPGRPQRVRVRLDGWAATNVREHLWHPSQKIVRDAGERVVAEFQLSSTVEFKRWVLGFGARARVLAPAELAREVAAELSEAARLYDGS